MNEKHDKLWERQQTMKRGKQVTGGSTSMASHSSVLACKPVPAMRVPFDLISRFKYRPFLSMRQILLFKLLISIFLPDQVSDLYLTISLPPSVMFLPKQKMQVAPLKAKFATIAISNFSKFSKTVPWQEKQSLLINLKTGSHSLLAMFISEVLENNCLPTSTFFFIHSFEFCPAKDKTFKSW